MRDQLGGGKIQWTFSNWLSKSNSTSFIYICFCGKLASVSWGRSFYFCGSKDQKNRKVLVHPPKIKNAVTMCAALCMTPQIERHYFQRDGSFKFGHDSWTMSRSSTRLMERGRHFPSVSSSFWRKESACLDRKFESVDSINLSGTSDRCALIR